MATSFKSVNQLSSTSILIWRLVQGVVWLIGATIFSCLVFYPTLGTLLFWNILIPIAPALIVVALGVWRNVCPLATTNLLPRHFGCSKRKRLSQNQSGKLNLISVLAFFIIVPLRHAVFNTNGVATAALIFSLAMVGFIAGFFYEWKSVWCSGLCPVHPVEKLYGSNVLMSIPNAHCGECQNCVIPCPDSTPNMFPNAFGKSRFHNISGWLITGGLPGFIWGWFHVPDQAGLSSVSSFLSVYEFPIMGFAITLLLFTIITTFLNDSNKRVLIQVYAAASVSCYYWFRIPSLIGFGNFESDGLLINLKGIIPSWIPLGISICTTLFFFFWLIIRKPNNNSWLIRPEFANK